METAVPIYTAANLPIITTGAPPFGQHDPASLPTDFIQAYEAVTPFEETAGPNAGSAYDAFQLLWLALDKAAQDNHELSRQSVAAALSGLQYQGLTGTVYQP